MILIIIVSFNNLKRDPNISASHFIYIIKYLRINDIDHSGKSGNIARFKTTGFEPLYLHDFLR